MHMHAHTLLDRSLLCTRPCTRAAWPLLRLCMARALMLCVLLSVGHQIPHVNVMSKMDLVVDQHRKTELESYLNPDPSYILEVLDSRSTKKQHSLNRAIASLVCSCS